ncbi:DUF4249 family protein [Dyadobacter sp. 32]|uniref:DUF4249 family protein n=1 Tax=Dyadobacter sp. 32 TaxID=538966 RepID=UPI0011ECF6DA
MKLINEYFSGLLVFFTSPIMYGCISEVSLVLPHNNRKVVIEGLLTDEVYDKAFQESHLRESEGNYVRLSYSDPVNFDDPLAIYPGTSNYTRDQSSPIRNALVWISDDLGQIDTLVADSAQNEPFIGYYTPRKLICGAGRTYILNVRIENDLYWATAYMPKVPIIDSVTSVYVKKPIEKFSGYLPVIYFRDNPSTVDYFMPKVVVVPSYTDAETPSFPHFNSGIGGRIWNYNTLSDTFLPEYVSGLTLKLGTTSSSYFTSSLELGQTYDACLFSLTKEAFDYYSTLIGQFESDGGAYKPTPASAPTNIKGGALGFFNASSASVKRFKVE